MTTPFRTRIRAALANPNLQAALDKNAEQRLAARQRAFGSLPEDLQTLRQRAHAVRAEVIASHEYYLQQFMAHAQNNGFVIHRAADAAEARQIVLEIAQKHGATLIAKSKTMVSEEIELNHALEAAGIQAIETDLGEYIVQLRQEPPSHIITPAVHLRREEVGETFHQKLGIPLTTEISTLTETARATLRQTFLHADIGLSGVNFGVAESGAICLVTNEGNGRMVTTIPRVHIALMGIERLVPSFDDLALMLTLLPRAATGQKITVYTQIIHGPRRADEIDGALERHLVLVDNGRRAIRGTPLNDTLLCIRCGACLNACPIFREIGGHAYTGLAGEITPYPGPIGSTLSPALFDAQVFGHLAQASTLCGACKEACPVDIDLPTMLLRVRAGQAGEQRPKLTEGVGLPALVRAGLRAFSWISTHPRRFAVAQKFAAALGRIYSPRRAWMRLPALTGWGYSKDFPRPAAKPFRERWVANNGQWPVESGKHATNQGTIQAAQPQSSNLPSSHSSLTHFQTELEALGGVFIRCEEGELAEQIFALLQERGLTQALAWEADRLPAGLAEALQNRGITLHHAPHPQIKVGITGATAGIAETGSLVITSGRGQALSVSLLPEIHLAILREADLKTNLAQALNLDEVKSASAAALVSGPSRTADIEMTLTIGVHGPGEVFVFCI